MIFQGFFQHMATNTASDIFSTVKNNVTKFDVSTLGIPALVLLIMAMLVIPLPPLIFQYGSGSLYSSEQNTDSNQRPDTEMDPDPDPCLKNIWIHIRNYFLNWDPDRNELGPDLGKIIADLQQPFHYPKIEESFLFKPLKLSFP